MPIKKQENNYYKFFVFVSVTVLTVIFFSLLFFIRPLAALTRKASIQRIAPNCYICIVQRVEPIQTGGESTLFSLEGYLLTTKQVNQIGQTNCLATISFRASPRTKIEPRSNQSTRITPPRVFKQDSYSDQVSAEFNLTEKAYESTKKGIERTRSTGDLGTELTGAEENKETLARQTSQIMSKTTNIGHELCSGKSVVFDKNINFNILSKFLKIGENWNLCWQTEIHFPEIGNLQGWFNFERLHGLTVDDKTPTLVKKVINDEKALENFTSGVFKVNQPFVNQSNDLQRVCNALSCSHNQQLLQKLKKDPDFSIALEWVWKSQEANLNSNMVSKNEFLCNKFSSFQEIDIKNLTLDDVDPFTLSDISQQLVAIKQTASINKNLVENQCQVNYCDNLNSKHNLHSYGDQGDYPELKKRNTVLKNAVDVINKKMNLETQEIGYMPAISKEEVLDLLAKGELFLNDGQIHL